MLRYTRSGPKILDIPTSTPSKRLNWEFYAVVDGYCAPLFDMDENPQLQTRTLWVLSPDLTYGWTGERAGWERILFHFGFIPETLKEQIPGTGYREVRLNDSDIERIRAIHAEVNEQILNPNELSNLIFHRALIDLSLIALKEVPVKPILSLDDIAYQRVEEAVSWYVENMHKAPTIDAVSQAVNISTSHLRRHFHETKHCSPNAYFQRLRMERACKMLSKTTETLDQIARRCGFPNSSDFCRFFRKNTRTTPHTWRKRINPKKVFREGLEIADFNPGDKRQNAFFTKKRVSV